MARARADAMHRLTVDPPWDFAAWRSQARAALSAGVPPDAVSWSGPGERGLFGDPLPAAESAEAARVPRDFVPLAGALVLHASAFRHALPYRILWRLLHGEPELLRRSTDPDMLRAEGMRREIRRDLHKMKAFVRFRAVEGEDNTFVSWFEPGHQIVDAAAPFFARRFAAMRWSILTPYRSVHWDGQALRFEAGATRADAPDDDALEDLWRRYYAHIFNPARLNTAMMRKEMPQKYWRNLPEAHLITELVRDAGARAREMVERMPRAPNTKIRAPVAAAPVPDVDEGADLATLRAAAAACRNCELWQHATRTVFGEGPEDARILVVGEQPGDEEDLRGRPFVGPSGKLFDQALERLGLDRGRFYVTNAVKHFRFEQRGKFRLHRTPGPAHVRACRAWLEREMAAIRPDVVVCLGATAARAVFGVTFKLMQSRGQWQEMADGVRGIATVHPSWILRLRQRDGDRDAAWQGFLEDLSLLQGV